MAGKTTDTRERLLAAARSEFMQHGFEGASLHRMAAAVGIAAPSVYNHFTGKQAMFAALAEPIVQRVRGTFHAVDARKQVLANTHQTDDLLNRDGIMQSVLDFAFDHLDDVKLLLFCAAGTPYEGILDQAARMEAEATLQMLEGAGHPAFTSQEREAICLIMRHQYHTYAEAIKLGYSREHTAAYWRMVSEFYTPGWRQMLHLDD